VEAPDGEAELDGKFIEEVKFLERAAVG